MASAAAASTSLGISITLNRRNPHKETLFLGHPRRTIITPILPLHPSFRSTVLTFSRRRRNTATPVPIASKKIKKKKSAHKKIEVADGIDGDAFDALFHMLEEDLKNDGLSIDDGEEDISEEDLLKLERELAEALADDELLGALDSAAGGETEDEAEEEEGEKDDDDGEVEDEDEEDDEEEMPVKLKSWQLRRLARALRNGRRKTNIKNLSADLCLDRAVVLKLLRDPPSNLVMMSASLPDQPASTFLEPMEETVTTIPTETIHAAKPEIEVKVPVHVRQGNWSAQKRLKKVQVETLEQVYRRTKRPTNAMISSIVHVTNLPRKKVVKWFEDRRAEDGVPDSRLPYQRPASESVFTS